MRDDDCLYADVRAPYAGNWLTHNTALIDNARKPGIVELSFQVAHLLGYSPQNKLIE